MTNHNRLTATDIVTRVRLLDPIERAATIANLQQIHRNAKRDAQHALTVMRNVSLVLAQLECSDKGTNETQADGTRQ